MNLYNLNLLWTLFVKHVYIFYLTKLDFSQECEIKLLTVQLLTRGLNIFTAPEQLFASGVLPIHSSFVYQTDISLSLFPAIFDRFWYIFGAKGKIDNRKRFLGESWDPNPGKCKLRQKCVSQKVGTTVFVTGCLPLYREWYIYCVKVIVGNYHCYL